MGSKVAGKKKTQNDNKLDNENGSQQRENINTKTLLKGNLKISNYKYLDVKGSNIYNDLYWPIYCFIKMKGGNTFQKLHVAICSLFGLKRTFYLGKFSYLFTLPFTSKLYKLLNEWYVL